MIRTLALAALLAWCPSLAFAQDPPTVAVMAVGGTVGVEASAWLQSAEAIEARLREAGFAVDDTGLPRRDDCVELTCLRGERESRGVDLLVTLTLFVGEGGTDQAGSIVVSMVDATGQYVGDESVDGRDAAMVAGLALSEARVARERGQEPWLHVSGTPIGAMVLLDGRELGILPYEGRVSEGTHRVEVRLGGYDAETHEVEGRRGEISEVEVALEASGSGGGGGAAPVVPGILIGTGGAAIVAGAVTLGLGVSFNGMAGDCVRPPMPLCRDYVPAGDGDDELIGGGVALGVGAAMLVVGVIVLVLD